MNIVIAKVNGRNSYKKLLSNCRLYKMPSNLLSASEYIPDTMVSDDEWFELKDFSKKDYFPKLLKNKFDSTNYPESISIETDKISYIVSYQDDNNFFFQRVPKAQLLKKKFVSLGNTIEFNENTHCIIINDFADAIYKKDEDILYFKDLAYISPIFYGIDELFKEATEEEVKDFLNMPFISLSDGFCSSFVKKQNRKRIALAKQVIKDIRKDAKPLLEYIHEYCPELKYVKSVFTISNKEALQYLLWGIQERYYTTPVGNEKRVANSIKKIG
jgi:hypothetical protein